MNVILRALKTIHNKRKNEKFIQPTRIKVLNYSLKQRQNNVFQFQFHLCVKFAIFANTEELFSIFLTFIKVEIYIKVESL